MALEVPVWMQEGTYSARQDRQLIAALSSGGVVAPHAGGFAVSERAAGPNFTVDVAAGRAVVPGTSQPGQGSYLCVSTATENVAVPPAPGANSRVDLVVVRVRDSQVAGPDNDFVVEVVEGVAGADPVAPAVPDDAVALAEVVVSSDAVAVTDSMIGDRRQAAGPQQEFFHSEIVDGVGSVTLNIPAGFGNFLVEFGVTGQASSAATLRARINGIDEGYALSVSRLRGSEVMVVGSDTRDSPYLLLGGLPSGDAGQLAGVRGTITAAPYGDGSGRRCIVEAQGFETSDGNGALSVVAGGSCLTPIKRVETVTFMLNTGTFVDTQVWVRAHPNV